MQLMKMGRTCIHIGAVQLARLLQANRGQHHTRRLKLHRYGIGIPSACQRRNWGLEFHEAAKHVHKSITASSKVHKSKKKRLKDEELVTYLGTFQPLAKVVVWVNGA